MSVEKVFSFASLQDRTTICRYLEVVRDGFQQGTINFSHKDKSLILKPHGLIRFEIKAGFQEKEVMLNLAFRWEEQEEDKFCADSFQETPGADQDN
jgi:amphi-Trp domain-containing protein